MKFGKYTEIKLNDGFEAACYDQNSIEELIDALKEKKADYMDCKQWNISPSEWKEQIKNALLAKINTMRSFLPDELL